jgi:hypothetical protein
MSEFELVDEFADEPPTTKGQWTLSRDEAATIWYALSAYKKQPPPTPLTPIPPSRTKRSCTSSQASVHGSNSNCVTTTTHSKKPLASAAGWTPSSHTTERG